MAPADGKQKLVVRGLETISDDPTTVDVIPEAYMALSNISIRVGTLVGGIMSESCPEKGAVFKLGPLVRERFAFGPLDGRREFLFLVNIVKL